MFTDGSELPADVVVLAYVLLSISSWCPFKYTNVLCYSELVT